MPILDDIMDHELFGPVLRQGRQEGREEGRKEGRQEGHQELFQLLLKTRFGAVPEWVQSRLNNLSASELDALAVSLLSVARLEDLFPNRQ